LLREFCAIKIVVLGLFDRLRHWGHVKFSSEFFGEKKIGFCYPRLSPFFYSAANKLTSAANKLNLSCLR
jgi:hypothetical protein